MEGSCKEAPALRERRKQGARGLTKSAFVGKKNMYGNPSLYPHQSFGLRKRKDRPGAPGGALIRGLSIK